MGVTYDPNYAYTGVNPLTSGQCQPSTTTTTSTSTSTQVTNSTPHTAVEPGACAAPAGPGGVDQPGSGRNGQQVTPGEVCTNDIASQKYNITTDDAMRSFLSTNTLQSFDALLDEPKGAMMTTSLCQESPTEADVVYPLCSIEYGLGFKRMVSDPGKCITAACPDGFIANGQTCDKTPVLKDHRRDKKGYCEERWYDWFTIPNYHLGNSYSNISQNSNVKCMNPCSPGLVPEYHLDPVDYESWGDGKNKLESCVNKDEYFYGKYADSDDFCPLAMIHKITHSTDVVSSNLTVRYNSISSHTNKTLDPVFSALQDTARITQDSSAISALAQQSNLPAFVQMPDDRTQRACNGLNTSDRVGYAYTVCSNVKFNLAHSSLSNISGSNLILLKQACNAVFANDGCTALDIINQGHESMGTPIQFTDVDIMNTPIQENRSNNPYDPSYNLAPADVPQFKTILPNGIKIAIVLILAPFVIFLLYILWKQFRKLMRWIDKATWVYGVREMCSSVFYTIYDSALFGRAVFKPVEPPFSVFKDAALAKYTVEDLKDQIEGLTRQIMFLNVASGERT